MGRYCKFNLDDPVWIANGRYKQPGRVVDLHRDKNGWWVVIKWTDSKKKSRVSEKREASIERREV